MTDTSNARFRRIILAIGVVALLLRLAAFQFALKKEAFFRFDYAIHTEIGRNAMNGNFSRTTDAGYLDVYERIMTQRAGLVAVAPLPKPAPSALVPVFYIDPGYGIQAGLLWKLMGRVDWTPVIVLQLLLDSAMVFLLFGIGLAVGRPRIGLWVAGFHAVFLLEIQQALVPHYDVFVTFYYISLVYLLLKERQTTPFRKSLLLMLAVGLLSAYISWIRSTVAFLPFVVALYLVVDKRRSVSFIKSAVLLVTFAAAFAVPKAAYNYQHFRRIDIVRGCKWWNIYTGLGQFANPFGLVGTDGDVVRYVSSVDPSIRLGPPGVLDYRRADELVRPHVLHLIKEHPVWYVTTCIKRAALVVFPGFYFDDRFAQKSTADRDWFSSILPWLSIVWRILILGLAAWSLLFLVGAVMGLRRDAGMYLVVLLPFIYSVVSIAPMFLQHRSLTNVYFIQFFFALLAIRELKAVVQRRRSASGLRVEM